MIFPASIKRPVTSISWRLGVGSPLGWLCKIITPAALRLMAALNSSRGWIAEKFSVPMEIVSLANTWFFGVEQQSTKVLSVQVAHFFHDQCGSVFPVI